MRLKLYTNNVTLSQSAISKSFKKMKITRNRIKEVYEKVNDANVINQRKDYSTGFFTDFNQFPKLFNQFFK